MASDFFPGKEHGAAAVTALRREIELHLAAGEPSARQALIEPRRIEDFQGRTWAPLHAALGARAGLRVPAS